MDAEGAEVSVTGKNNVTIAGEIESAAICLILGDKYEHEALGYFFVGSRRISKDVTKQLFTSSRRRPTTREGRDGALLLPKHIPIISAHHSGCCVHCA